MKIRHKQSGVELEGKFMECGEGGPCIPSVSYFACGRYGSRYDMREWEAVPEWVDVTAECEEYTGWWHGNRLIVPYLDLASGYRLRKVSAVTLYPEGKAFIVERKV